MPPIVCIATELDPVFRLGEYDRGMKLTSLFRCHLCVSHNDDHIVRLHKTGGSSIEADTARSTFTFNNIGNEALAIVIVHNMYLLTFEHASCIHQILVDGNAAHIVEIGLGDTGTMYLRFQYSNQHRLIYI